MSIDGAIVSKDIFSSKLEELKDASLDASFNRQEHDTKLKWKIAIWFVAWFFIVLLWLPVTLFCLSLWELGENITILELVDSIKNVAALIWWIVWTPLGIVIWYYFKSRE